MKDQLGRFRYAGLWLTSLRKIVAAGFLAFTSVVFSQASLFDPSFGVGAGADGMIYAGLVQSDGKIVVGGAFNEIAGQIHPNLARLNPDGSLDNTFPTGTDGSVYRLQAQPDGNVLVGGNFSTLQGVTRQGIGRLLTNGTVDGTFDAGVLPGSNQSVFAMALQPDGKILYGNLANPGELFRLTTNGQIDTTFVQTNKFNGYYLFTIHVRTNGSILAGGGFQAVNGFGTAGLALLNSNGLPDTSFTSQLKTNSTAMAILEQADGRLWVGGVMWRMNPTNRFSLARLTSSLAWDSSFQPDLFGPDVPGYGYIRSMLALPDGKVCAGGNFEDVGGYWRRQIVRLDSDGKVDPCFDPGVGLGMNYSAPFGVVALARQSDGRLVVGGSFIELMSNAFRRNITRVLPQSASCANRNAHLFVQPDGTVFVAATFPPGGMKTLQVSTNLVDWMDYASGPRPYQSWYFDPSTASSEVQFFVRGKQDY